MDRQASPIVDDVRVLLIGDDPLARSGLHVLLDGQAGLVLIGQVGADEVASALQSSRPQVAVWDLGLEARGALGRLRALPPDALPVLALVPDEQVASEAIGVGARGALLRDSDRLRLAAAVVAVGRGCVVVDDALAGAVLPGRPTLPETPAEPLTARELEVMQLLAQGMANKTIAAQLGISEHTAKFHVNAILAKLGVQSRTEAVVRAARLGMVML